jgi:hypothetical protein
MNDGDRFSFVLKQKKQKFKTAKFPRTSYSASFAVFANPRLRKKHYTELNYFGAVGVHEKSELQFFQARCDRICVKEKIEVGFRGGFSLFLSFCGRKRKKRPF